MEKIQKNHLNFGILLCCLVLCSLPLSAQSTLAPGAGLVVVYDAPGLYFEGPTWDATNQQLLFSTPNTAPYDIYRLAADGQVSVWMPNSQRVNGTFLAVDGRLLTAETQAQAIGSYQLTATSPQDAQVLASASGWYYPNDICQRPQGDIYFTSVNWDNLPVGVYRISPQGGVSQVISDMLQPNGIITSNDGSQLYVSDSGQKLWKVYPIHADGTLGSGSVFFNPASSSTNVPDGMTIDEFGNLYFNGLGGLWIVSPQGVQLDFISIAEFNSNATFGGADGSLLYITCQDRVYSLQTTVRGAAWADTGPQPASGDVNGSGSVDIVDALMIAQYYVGLDPPGFSATQADVNCSGSVDIVDALLVAQFYVGLVSSYPC